MSSNKPPILQTIRSPGDSPTDLRFSIGDLSVLVEFAKFGKSTASVIREINKALQSLINSIKNFLAILSGVTNFFQGLLALGKSFIQDALSLGGHVIIVHPWNQRNPKYKSMVYNAIKKKKQKQLKANELNQRFFTRIRQWFDDITVAASDATTQPIDVGIRSGNAIESISGVPTGTPIGLGIPQLSVQEAINEILWACDNTKDPLRPKFTSRMYTCGIGFILNVTNPLDLTGMIDALKALFDFSEFDQIQAKLTKRYEDFRKQVDNRGSSLIASIVEKNTAEYQAEWEALGVKAEFQALSAKQANEEFRKPASDKSRLNIKPNVKNAEYTYASFSKAINRALIIGDSGPAWFGLRIDMIPVLKDIRDTIEMVLDGGFYFVSFINDSIIDVVTIIMKKITFIMDNLEKIASMLDSIDKLRGTFLAGGAYFFMIEPEIGGMDHLKSDLQALIPMVPNSRVPGYTVMIALVAGFPNYGDANAYMSQMTDLINGVKKPVSQSYGLHIFLEPNPSSAYAMTDHSTSVLFAVRSLGELEYTYKYHYRAYNEASPLDVINYSSGVKQSSDFIVLQARPDFIYELEVRADTKVKSVNPEKDFDVQFYRFKIIQRIDLSVITDSAIVEKIDSDYYLHVPVTVRVYNFSVGASVKYVANGTTVTSSIDITEYEILTDENDIDYADLSFDAVYLITFTNTRPDAITDTVRAFQKELNEKEEFTIDSETLKKLIKTAKTSPVIPGFDPGKKPKPEPTVKIPSTFPPDPRKTVPYCISELVARFLDRNKRCEIVIPVGTTKTLLFYDCHDSISSMKFYITFNEGKYDRDLEDAATSRVPAQDNEYFYATATTTTPASFELSGFILGYYVIRVSVYWKPGSIRYQKAGGVTPQSFDIYVKVLDGEKVCFLVE